MEGELAIVIKLIRARAPFNLASGFFLKLLLSFDDGSTNKTTGVYSVNNSHTANFLSGLVQQCSLLLKQPILQTLQHGIIKQFVAFYWMHRMYSENIIFEVRKTVLRSNINSRPCRFVSVCVLITNYCRRDVLEAGDVVVLPRVLLQCGRSLQR